MSDEPIVFPVREELQFAFSFSNVLHVRPPFPLYIDHTRERVGHPPDEWWPLDSQLHDDLHRAHQTKPEGFLLLRHWAWNLRGWDYFLAMSSPFACAHQASRFARLRSRPLAIRHWIETNLLILALPSPDALPLPPCVYCFRPVGMGDLCPTCRQIFMVGRDPGRGMFYVCNPCLDEFARCPQCIGLATARLRYAFTGA